jgi:hypothetical protein
MNTLLSLIVAESFVFGAMWHNKSQRSEKGNEIRRPDPAVLLSGKSTSLQKQALVGVPSTLQSLFVM